MFNENQCILGSPYLGQHVPILCSKVISFVEYLPLFWEHSVRIDSDSIVNANIIYMAIYGKSSLSKEASSSFMVGLLAFDL